MILKKKVYFLLLFLTINSFIPAYKNKIFLRLPVRINKNVIKQAQNFKKEDFILFINNESRPISHLTQIKRSLSDSPLIGRNFLLSFHIIDYDQSIENGINYFLEEIADTNDLLLVASPYRIYQIKISSNKEKISRRIKKIIINDCKQFRKSKILYEKKILQYIQRIYRSFTSDFSTSRLYLSSANYMKYIEREFNQYKRKFIWPDLTKLQSVQKPFDGREGNHWFIHIQQKKIFSFVSRLPRHLENLKRFHYLPLYKAIIKFKNESLYSDLFPFEQMKNIIIGKNYCFNFIFQNASEKIQSTTLQNLNKMTEDLGGMFFCTESIQQGFEKAHRHQDRYLELNYLFNGRIENKKINLLMAGKESGLIYPKNYNKNDISFLINSTSKKRIEIQDITLEKNRITFTVKSYEINREKKFAILKIKIEAFNEHKTCLYKTQNTLRASEESVKISVPLPRLDSETISLNIEAYDILGNNFTAVEHNLGQNQRFSHTTNQ